MVYCMVSESWVCIRYLKYAGDFSSGVQCGHYNGAPTMDVCGGALWRFMCRGMAWASGSWGCCMRCVLPCACDVWWLW